MKKIVLVLVIGAMLTGLLSGCGVVDAINKQTKYDIICTTFPQYDWLRQVIGEDTDTFGLTLLLDSSVDLHSYQPTAIDIEKIISSDMFVYVGGESDGWVTDVLTANQTNTRAVAMMDFLHDLKEEELVEGMQETEHDHEHGEEEHEEDEHDEHDEHEYDEHVWLSLSNAKIIVNGLADTLQELNRERANYYKSNASAYCKKLTELDEQFFDIVNGGARKTLLFADRFPFRYFVEDYNLDYYAAFAGCSAESEASFETITFLAGKVDELKLPVIITLEGSDGKIADAVLGAVKGEKPDIVTFNAIQSVTSETLETASYLSLMQSNLLALTAAVKQ